MATNTVYRVIWHQEDNSKKTVTSDTHQDLIAATAGDEATLRTALTNIGLAKNGCTIRFQSICPVLSNVYS